MLEFEWQKVYSNIQVSSLYALRSSQCFSLDGLHSSSYFHVLESLFESFRDFTERTDYKWYKR